MRLLAERHPVAALERGGGSPKPYRKGNPAEGGAAQPAGLRRLRARQLRRLDPRLPQRALPRLRRPRRLAHGRLDAEHQRAGRPGGNRIVFSRSTTTGSPGRRRRTWPGPATPQRPGAHGQLGLPDGLEVRPHLRALQPQPGQQRLDPDAHRHDGRRLQRRRRQDLVQAADHPHAQEPLRRPRRQDPRASGSSGRSPCAT